MCIRDSLYKEAVLLGEGEALQRQEKELIARGIHCVRMEKAGEEETVQYLAQLCAPTLVCDFGKERTMPQRVLDNPYLFFAKDGECGGEA